MSLEAKIDALTAVLTELLGEMKANTAALGGSSKPAGKTSAGKTSAPADKVDKSTKAAGKGKSKAADEDAPEITKQQMQGALITLRDKHGIDYAKEVIADAGGVSDMKDIKASKYGAVYKAALARVDELDEEGGNDDDDDDDDSGL